MPIYEYLCESCGRITERMQKVTDPPPRSCPECGARKIAKLVSRSAFQLKGGGWYADLYSSRKRDAAGGESKPAASGDKAPPGPKAGVDKAAPAPEADVKKSGTRSASEKKTSAG